MNAQAHDAYLAIIDDLETRLRAASAMLAAVQQTSIGLADVSVAQSKQLAALEAAARAVVDWATVADAIAGYPACRCCGRVIDGWDTHRHADCPMGALAALVEERDA